MNWIKKNTWHHRLWNLQLTSLVSSFHLWMHRTIWSNLRQALPSLHSRCMYGLIGAVDWLVLRGMLRFHVFWIGYISFQLATEIFCYVTYVSCAIQTVIHRCFNHIMQIPVSDYVTLIINVLFCFVFPHQRGFINCYPSETYRCTKTGYR
jgi:hypothetical protein